MNYQNGGYNPFMPFGQNPYLTPTPVPQTQPPKTPQQIEAETKAMNEQYRNAYGMMANMGQAPQMPQGAPENTYVKIQSYEEVRQAQAPSDGRPLVFIAESEGMLYSKKMDKGIEYVKAFRLVPEELPKAEPQDNSGIAEMLQKINERLDRLEGNGNGRQYPDEDAPKAKSWGI